MASTFFFGNREVRSTGAYRADIDGLRCVAILLVVFFHAFPTMLPGGFVGVDVFFVISGYLITALLLRQYQTDSYSILKFYSRRIRRIFPALILMILVQFAIAWWVLLPQEFRLFGRNMAGAASFASNFILLAQSGYFAPDANRNALLHLWSLGVEEQFYILWPPILITLTRNKSSPVAAVAAMIFASLALNFAEVNRYPDFAFFHPLARCWELLTGAILAQFECGSRLAESATWLNPWGGLSAEQKKPPHHNVLRGIWHSRAIIGLGLIVAAAIVFDNMLPYPGWRAIVPVAGALLVISSRNNALNNKLLSHPVAVGIGLISYPLYLWHWPLLTFARIYMGAPLSGGMIAGILILSVVLAYLTFVCIERPARSEKIVPFKVALLCCGMALVAALGIATEKSGGFSSRLPEQVRAASSITFDLIKYWREGSCFLKQNQDASQFAAECDGNTQRPLIFLWGDSHAAALYPGLSEVADSMHVGLAQFSSSGCPPLLSQEQINRPFCEEINDHIYAKLLELKPRVVILHSQWASDLSKLSATIERIRGLKFVKTLIVVGPVPLWTGIGLPENVAEYYQKTGQLLPQRTHFRERLDIRQLDEDVRHIAEVAGARYVSAWEILCNEEGCLTRTSGRPEDLTAWDTAHLTLQGSRFLAARLDPIVSAGLESEAP